MSVTAVPLRPIAKGSLGRLWIGVAAVALAAAGLAYAGQSNLVASPAAFLAKNGKEAGVVTTDSGLQYKVITPGTGKSPKATDTVDKFKRFLDERRNELTALQILYNRPTRAPQV